MKQVGAILANLIAIALPILAITHLLVTLAEKTAPAPPPKTRTVYVETPDLDFADRPREASSLAGVSSPALNNASNIELSSKKVQKPK